MKQEKEYKDLSYLEGREVDFRGGIYDLTNGWVTRSPEKCYFLKDYPKTVLLQMVWIRDYKGRVKPPRTIKKLVSKASMYCGDVVINDGLDLVGERVWG